MATQRAKHIEVVYSYSHEDARLLRQLEKHLANLKRQGIITAWYDRKIGAGKEWAGEIDERLNSARVILLLVSPSFMASDYCNDVEVKLAMERHQAKQARVIPVLLRPVDWDGAPFSKLQFLPSNAKPVTGWSNRDKAFEDVAKGIRAAVEELSEEGDNSAPPPSVPTSHVINFVRRYDEKGRDILERLKTELAPENKRLVALWGKGGVGKTRLAAEAASALTKRFGQRIIWASAEKRTDFTLSTLLDEAAKQLGQPELLKLAQDPKKEAVSALLIAAPTLVVLDNFETVEAEDERSRCVDFLTQQVKCSSLITTRQRVSSARNIPVRGMSSKEAHEFLEQAVEQTQEPNIFTKQARNRIIKTAEANPYVMLWVVGQIDEAKSPKRVLDELEQGKGDAAERVFDRSFNLPQVGDDGRAVLLALSLFVPSASHEALAAVAGFGDDTARLDNSIKALRTLWLLGTAQDHERLTLEGLTRSLASAHLSRDARADEFRQRFVKYFLSFAEAHAQPTPEDYDLLEVEKDNLLGAMDAAFDSKDWLSVIAMAYAIAAPGVLYVHGYWDEALRRNEQAMEAARLSQIERDFASFAHNAAIMYQNRGEIEEAIRLYNESLEINKKLGDQRGIASTLHQLGWLAQAQGELTEARRLYDESLEIEKKLGNQSGIASTLHQLAMLAHAQGELTEARRLYDESLEIKKKLGDQRGIAITLHELGRLSQAQGELTEARQLYDESLEIKKKLGNQSGIAITLGQLGLLAEAEGDKVEAARLFREVLRIFEKLGSPYAAMARRDLARVEGEGS